MHWSWKWEKAPSVNLCLVTCSVMGSQFVLTTHRWHYSLPRITAANITTMVCWIIAPMNTYAYMTKETQTMLPSPVFLVMTSATVWYWHAPIPPVIPECSLVNFLYAHRRGARDYLEWWPYHTCAFGKGADAGFCWWDRLTASCTIGKIPRMACRGWHFVLHDFNASVTQRGEHVARAEFGMRVRVQVITPQVRRRASQSVAGEGMRPPSPLRSRSPSPSVDSVL